MLPFITLLVYLISKKGIPLFTGHSGPSINLSALSREYRRHTRYKALSKTAYGKERFGKVNSEVVKNESRAGITMALTNPEMNLLLNRA